MDEIYEQKLDEKRRIWEKGMRPFERAYMKTKKEIKYNVTNWLDWYFGDGSQKDKVDKMLRRFGIILVDLLILRALGFI